MLTLALLLVTAEMSPRPAIVETLNPVAEATKKKRRSSSAGSARRFSSCAAARKAGYTHMRRGKPGYSTNLDRDGDGVACDKVG
jgi:hypothetical protein